MNQTAYNPRIAGGLATGVSAMTATQVNACQEPVREAHVNEYMRLLVNNLATLRDRVQQLDQKLIPVLNVSADAPRNACDKVPESYLVPLADALRSANRELHELSEWVISICGRVEL